MRFRNVYYFALFCSLAVGLYTILSITPSKVILLNSNTILTFLQRLFGLWAFTLLFFQVILGSYMFKVAQRLGSWVHKVHITQGLFAYALTFFHPFVYFIILAETSKKINPFYIYTDFCILCKTRPELFSSFGRVSFWVLTLTVTAALLRTMPIFRNKWKFFHYLNYVAFFAVGIHAWGIGSDVHTPPYLWFHVGAMVVVSLIVLAKLWKATLALFRNFRLTEVATK